MEDQSPSTEYFAKLRRQLDTYFSLGELRTLCFDIGVDYENLAGDNKSELTRSLIAYLRRRDQLQELIRICHEVRPNVEWAKYRPVDIRKGPEIAELQPTQARYLRIFLCHASPDKPAVRELYKKLIADGFEPWLDEENILAGQDWELEITKALRTCDVIIVCSSKESVSKAGYVQREIRFALDRAVEQAEGSIFLIPLKLQLVIHHDYAAAGILPLGAKTAGSLAYKG